MGGGIRARPLPYPRQTQLGHLCVRTVKAKMHSPGPSPFSIWLGLKLYLEGAGFWRGATMVIPYFCCC